MGNKQSKGVTPEPSKVIIPSGVSCTIADTGLLDRRIYQTELIDRACDVLQRVLETGRSTADFVLAQTDAMNYKSPDGYDDEELKYYIGNKPQTYRRHQWTILLHDSLFLGRDRRNPFELFQKPVDVNESVDVVRSQFTNHLKRFKDARLAGLAGVKLECVKKK